MMHPETTEQVLQEDGTGKRSIDETQDRLTEPWRKAETELGATVESIQNDIQQHYDRWREEVSSENDRLKRAIERAIAEHRSLTESFAERWNSTPLGERGNLLGQYRTDTHRQVLDVFGELLSEYNIAENLYRRFERLVKNADGLTASLPESVRLHLPVETFRKTEGDSGWIQLRKLLTRSRLNASARLLRAGNFFRRLVRKEQARPVPLNRLVPVADVVQRRLRSDLMPLWSAEMPAACSSIAKVVAHLETTVSDWADAVLIVERDLEFSDTEVLGKVDWGALPQPPVVKEEGAEPQKEIHEKEEEEETDEIWEALERCVRDLQDGLEAAIELDAQEDAARGPAFDDIFARVRSDLAIAGTFLLSNGEVTTDQSIPAAKVLPAVGAWSSWFTQVADRLQYIRFLFRIRDATLNAESSLTKRVGRATVTPVLETFAAMAKRFSQASENLEYPDIKTADEDTARKYAETLVSLRDALLTYLERVFRDLPGLVSSDQVLADPARTEWDALSTMTDDLPELLRLHPLHREEEAPVNPDGRTTDIRFRGLVSDALVIPLPERLRKPAEGLRAAVRRVWTDTEQIQHIVQYNIDAAIDELVRSIAETADDDVPSEEEAEAPPTPADAVESATKLTIDGLSRASTTLGQFALTLRKPWEAVVEATDRELQEDWVAIHRRLRQADSTDEQWAGLRSRAQRQVEKQFERGKHLWRVARDRVGRLALTGRRRVESLITIGRSAVGVLDSGDEVRFETIDALASVDGLQASLPLIYRRLFSFEPLEEATLLEGRSRDLVWVRKHYLRWAGSGQPGHAIIQSPLGSGRTSFLRTLQSTVFKDEDVRYINLKERIYDPNEFAKIVATALDIEIPDITVEKLEERLIQTRRKDPPLVCMVDNLEHLVLRASQKTNTFERVILLLSRTDKSVYWLGTIGVYAWQFLSKTASTAVGFVDSYALTPVDRSVLESVIVNRHRRSGMMLNFIEPSDPSAIMRQRLRRAKTAEDKQRILREDYFDRLWKASGQTVMLALYYWIRSVEFKEDDSTLSVPPLKPLNFEFMSGFDLAHAFTLKAFILHKTLSLADHCRVFRMDRDASTAILESLLNHQLIEVVAGSDQKSRREHHIRSDARYRLKPLLMHPVTMFLQTKNIVY